MHTFPAACSKLLVLVLILETSDKTSFGIKRRMGSYAYSTMSSECVPRVTRHKCCLLVAKLESRFSLEEVSLCASFFMAPGKSKKQLGLSPLCFHCTGDVGLRSAVWAHQQQSFPTGRSFCSGPLGLGGVGVSDPG